MSSTTIRKLRRISDGGKDTSYFLLPPQNWLDTIEKKEGRLFCFSLKTQTYALVLSTECLIIHKKKVRVIASPEMIVQMLKGGNLIVKLREVRKGTHVYRTVNIPRVWVRAREKGVNRKVIALSLTTYSGNIC